MPITEDSIISAERIIGVIRGDIVGDVPPPLPTAIIAFDFTVPPDTTSPDRWNSTGSQGGGCQFGSGGADPLHTIGVGMTYTGSEQLIPDGITTPGGSSARTVMIFFDGIPNRDVTRYLLDWGVTTTAQRSAITLATGGDTRLSIQGGSRQLQDPQWPLNTPASHTLTYPSGGLLSQVRMYQDGSQAITTNTGGTDQILDTVSNSLSIGSTRTGTSNLVGIIAKIFIWNEVLSPSQIFNFHR